MKHKLINSTTVAAIALLSLAASALAFQSSGHSGGCCGQGQSSPAKPQVAQQTKDVQKATVMVQDGKYSPSTIQVKKGKKVILTFKGGKNMGCGSTIEFKSLKQTKTVKEGGTVTFTFTPQSAGEIKFACSMDMIRGKVVVN